MILEGLLICNAVATTPRGEISLIGVELPITVAPTLPAPFVRNVFVSVSDEDEAIRFAKGDTFTSGLVVRAPSGKIVATDAATISFGEKPLPQFPGVVRWTPQLRLTIEEYGSYLLTVTVTTSVGHSLAEERTFYVVPEPTTR